MEDNSEFNEGCNLLGRWFHWALFFVMVVAGSFLTGLPREAPENYYFAMAWMSGAGLFIEAC